MYPYLRPLLFALEPETAHRVTLSLLDVALRLGLVEVLAGRIEADPRVVMGLDFPNPVGLAAGLDKDGAHIDSLAAMGFGFIEVGTVTPRPQAGNARPRLFRVRSRDAIINRMGFNNGGLQAFLSNVQRARYRGILGLNIGKNADTPIERAVDDYLVGLRAVFPHASYVTVNISSPNTKNLRSLQAQDALDPLLSALKMEHERLRQDHGRHVPLVLKIAPDLDSGQIGDIARALVKHRIDGVIATNTTLSREGVEDCEHADESGGLSGSPLTARSGRVVEALARELDGALPIIGVGGIASGADAALRQRAGAQLIQLYTGLIYRGPALIGECARALAGRCPS